MRFLISTIGSSGDVFPFIAIARALQARGHEATLIVDPTFERAAAEAGVAFLPLGKPFDFERMGDMPDVAHPSRGSITILRNMVMNQSPGIYADVLRALKRLRPAALITHHICFGAAWAAQTAGVRIVRTTLAPLGWFNVDDSLVLDNHFPERSPRWLKWLAIHGVGRWIVRQQLGGPLNKARRSLRLPARPDLFREENLTGDLILGMWSKVYRDELAGDPPAGRICGFPWHDRPTHPSREGRAVEQFLSDCERRDDRPLVFTLGTAVVHVAGRYYHDAAEACGRLGKPGLLVCSRPELLPQAHELPKGVMTTVYAPFSEVFARAAVNVHHGGIGTTAQALRAGRPTVITPVSYDQFDNAARAKRLGVSQTLHAQRITPARLAQALEVVLRDDEYARRATRIGAAIGAEDGAARAAEEIEKSMTR